MGGRHAHLHLAGHAAVSAWPPAMAWSPAQRPCRSTAFQGAPAARSCFTLLRQPRLAACMRQLQPVTSSW